MGVKRVLPESDYHDMLNECLKYIDEAKKLLVPTQDYDYVRVCECLDIVSTYLGDLLERRDLLLLE